MTMLSTMPSNGAPRVQRRRHRRAPAPDGMRVRLGHPWLRDAERPWYDVIDLAAGGMAIVVEPDAPLLAGLAVPCIELHTADRPARVVRLRGEVRHVTRDGRGRHVCGLAVSPWPADAVAWLAFVSAALAPATAIAAGRIEPLWQLFTESGFFALAGRDAASFAALRESFASFAERAAVAPELACQLVWPSPRGVEASISTLKSHAHTWWSYQVAKRRVSPPGTPPGAIMRDIYTRIYTHPQLDPDFRWAVAFVERTAPAVDRSHVQFARAHAASGLAACMPVRLLRAACSDRSSVPRDPRLVIEPATADERAALAAELARTRPRAWLEALDFVPERIGLDAVVNTWRRAGWCRERAFIVARRADRAEAMLVLERGEPGASLFQLFELARIVPLVPRAELTPGLHAALVDVARQWFLRRGLSAFIVVREDDDASWVEDARLTDSPSAEPYLWIVAAELIPAMIDHINTPSSPSSPSKE